MRTFAGKSKQRPEDRPVTRYTNCEVYAHMRVDYSSLNPELRTLLTFTGANLHALAAESDSAVWELIYDLNALDDIHWTRIDGALDIRDSGANIKEFFDAWERGDMRSHVTSGHLIKSGDKNAPAYTAYIGSRTSPRMLRVYDKGKETGDGGDWTRVEIEVKKPHAAMFARQIAEWGINRAVISQIKTFLPGSGFDWFDSALETAEPLPSEHIGRKATKGQRWLYEVALTSVQAAILRGDEVVIHGVENALKTIWGDRTL